MQDQAFEVFFTQSQKFWLHPRHLSLKVLDESRNQPEIIFKRIVPEILIEPQMGIHVELAELPFQFRIVLNQRKKRARIAQPPLELGELRPSQRRFLRLSLLKIVFPGLWGWVESLHVPPVLLRDFISRFRHWNILF